MKSKIIFLVLWFIYWAGAGLVLAGQEESRFNESILLGDVGKSLLSSSKAIPSASRFSWINLMGGLIFSGIGFVAFTHGKKRGGFRPLFIGIALMVYPYFLSQTFWLYAAGIGLCALLYYWRN